MCLADTFCATLEIILRLCSQMLPQMPVSRRQFYGDFVFSVADPCLWNRLLESNKNAVSLEIFKSLLKTHHFEIVFFSSKSIMSSSYLSA